MIFPKVREGNGGCTLVLAQSSSPMVSQLQRPPLAANDSPFEAGGATMDRMKRKYAHIVMGIVAALSLGAACGASEANYESGDPALTFASQAASSSSYTCDYDNSTRQCAGTCPTGQVCTWKVGLQPDCACKTPN
jgi:hypothetical protein